MERQLKLETRHKITDTLFQDCARLMVMKGADYSPSGRAFESFEVDGQDKKAVLRIYMLKHQKAIDTYIQNGKVESEDIRYRIMDAINYLAILYAMISEEVCIKGAEMGRQQSALPPS